MKLNEMKQILASDQIQLTKSLGQNFLHDANQLRRIVEAAALEPTDKVLEIGPGLGPLTELLMARAGEVLAIEKDRRLAGFLQKQFGNAKNLSLLHDDGLDYLRREPRDWSDWKLVSNLPYSVASPLLVELAQAAGCPQRLVATLQLEVARRIVASASDDDYGVLSLLIQLRYEPQDQFKIPADCFFPVPDVDSACVVLVRREQPLLPAGLHPMFVRMVKLGFSQRRKMMLKLLKQDWPADKLAAAFEKLQLAPQIRAERVTLEQFVQLTNLLHHAAGPAAPNESGSKIG
jgi:16S rRNA (adenine1518-N6/adenine1519-N6)-dimethyltransferase